MDKRHSYTETIIRRLWISDVLLRKNCNLDTKKEPQSMTDEQKALFEKYTDCVREHQTITDCLIFQNSFKLGARMMLEVMEDM